MEELKEYYYNSTIRSVFKIIPLLMLPLIIIMIFLGLQLEDPIVMTVPVMIIILSTGVLYFVFRKFYKPQVIISDEGVSFKVAELTTQEYSLKWDELECFEIETVNMIAPTIKSGNNDMLKLIVKDKFLNIYKRPLVIGLKTLDKPDQLVNDLKEYIPDNTAKRRKELLDSFSAEVPQVYKKHLLNKKGLLLKSSVLIPWENIEGVQLSGLSIVGYRGVKIEYRNHENKVKTLKISPSAKEEYISFLKYLLKNIPEADIDPLIYNMIKITPAQAKAEEGILILTFSVFILVFVLFINELLIRYILDYLYLSILLPSLIFFVIVLIKLTNHQYTKRVHGDYTGIVKNYKLTKISSLLLVISFIFFFVITPGTLELIKGDIYISMGKGDKAIKCYQNVLEIYPEDIEILYTTANTYFQIEEYEESYELMVRAYEIFEGEWNALALKLLPDSLVKLDRYQEALGWCDRIIEENGEHDNIVEVMEDYRREVEGIK
ncbi:MAG: tetratricopeptide repeat protein [bacterium]